MKTQWTFRSVALCVALGSVAFALRGLAPLRSLTSPRHEVPRLDYFASAQSFSEVEQARAQLKALARRHLYLLQVQQVETLRNVRHDGPDRTAAEPGAVGEVLDEMGRAIQEFQGTGEEPALTNGLLILLASERAYGRWLDVYLDLLYRRPTEDLIGRLAGTAVIAGRASERLEEVVRGFRHLLGIPLDFDGKRQAQALLDGLEPDGGAGILANRDDRWESGAPHHPRPIEARSLPHQQRASPAVTRTTILEGANSLRSGQVSPSVPALASALSDLRGFDMSEARGTADEDGSRRPGQENVCRPEARLAGNG